MSTLATSRFVALAATLATLACNRANCEELRDELFAEKRSWQDCETRADCIKVFGNPGDCTGILSCDFAVNVMHRGDAERRVASLPEETADCIQCQSPNCVTGDIAVCEPATSQCIILTEILDGDGGDGP